ELPDAAAEPLDDDLLRDHQPLILSINAGGDLFLNIGKNEEQAIDEVTVVARTLAVLRREPETPVLVRADETVAFGRVVTAMVLLQQAGAKKVGFVTDPLEQLPVRRE
ncbi:MAG: biopolymer transporter ExbD, partial [Proteobacteria bacterium]|nr:biopolymer transporter ExbD [Pseudomonadota bacterium]